MKLWQNKEAQIDFLASLNPIDQSSSICLYSVSKFDRLNYTANSASSICTKLRDSLQLSIAVGYGCAIVSQHLVTVHLWFLDARPALMRAPLVSPSSLSIISLYLALEPCKRFYFLLCTSRQPSSILIFLMLQYGFEARVAIHRCSIDLL